MIRMTASRHDLFAAVVACATIWGCISSAPAGTTPSDHPSTQPTAAKRLTPQQVSADIEYAFDTIEKTHPNMYAYVSKGAVAGIRQRILPQTSGVTNRVELYKLLAPGVASLRSGHTCLMPPVEEYLQFLDSGGGCLPFEVRYCEDAVVVSKWYGSGAAPLGNKIVAIEGEPVDAVLQRLCRFFPAERKVANLWQLERYEILTLAFWLEYGSARHVKMHLQDGQGKVTEWSVELPHITSRQWKERFIVGNRHEYLKEQNAVWIEFREYGDQAAFQRFLKRVMAVATEQHASTLILDLRSNPGGSGTLNDKFLAHLAKRPFRSCQQVAIRVSPLLATAKYKDDPEARKHIGETIAVDPPILQPKPDHFAGQVYVLIGPRTTSAAVCLAAAAREYANAVIVGQETSDTMEIYCDSIPCLLPNSQLQLTIPTQQMRLAGSGSDDRGVTPDWTVQPGAVDVAEGRDSVLDYVRQRIKK